jgi:hypothetical protein
LPAVEATK